MYIDVCINVFSIFPLYKLIFVINIKIRIFLKMC